MLFYLCDFVRVVDGSRKARKAVGVLAEEGSLHVRPLLCCLPRCCVGLKLDVQLGSLRLVSISAADTHVCLLKSCLDPRGFSRL